MYREKWHTKKTYNLRTDTAKSVRLISRKRNKKKKQKKKRSLKNMTFVLGNRFMIRLYKQKQKFEGKNAV